MKELNQTTSFGTENKDLDCEIVREHLIPFWEMEEINSFKSHINKALKNYKLIKFKAQHSWGFLFIACLTL